MQADKDGSNDLDLDELSIAIEEWYVDFDAEDEDDDDEASSARSSVVVAKAPAAAQPPNEPAPPQGTCACAIS